MKSGTKDPSQWWNKNQQEQDGIDDTKFGLLVQLGQISGQIKELKIYIEKLEALKVKADNALLRYATLKSDSYEDSKAAREYLEAARELDNV